jgi:uncharacterized protein (TIRG00374 family)
METLRNAMLQPPAAEPSTASVLEGQDALRELPARPGGERAAERSSASPSRSRTWLQLLGRLAVSGALLGYLLLKLDVQEVIAHLAALTPGLVVLAWGYYAACQLLSSYRWQILLAARGIHVPLLRLFSFYMIGMFLNNFMPGAVGGDVVKIYCLRRETHQGKYAVISVFLERFTGLLGLSALSMATLAIAFHQVQSPRILAAVGGTALFLVIVVLLIWWPPLAHAIIRGMGRFFPRKLGEKLGQGYAALHSYRDHRKALLAAFLLSVVVQALYALYYALISQGLGIPISAIYFMLFLPLVTVVIMVPITIGGLGIREALMVALFAEVGVAGADVIAVSLTAYFLNTLLSLSGSILLLLQRPGPLPQENRPYA